MKKKNLGIMVFTVAALGALALVGCSGNRSQTESSSASQTAAETTGSGAAVETGETTETEGEAAEKADDLLSKIQEKGEIVIAMEGTWVPWTYHDEADNLVGYDVEVAQQIADRLGVKATFVEGEWDGLLAGLDAGRYDMMVNGVEMTEEREAKYDFTDPYGYIRTAIIVNGDNEEITAYEDLEGKSTANTISSTYAELAESYGAEVTGVDDLNQTFELLLSGRIDATLNAEVTYYDYMKEHPEANIKIAALTEEASHVAIPLRKGAETESLRAAINEALAELDEEGILSELSEKYFGSDISKAPNQ